MRIDSIMIRNFRALEFMSISNLRDFVLIAGPNGSGKSCVLDAIRMLKSHYGGYVPNEIDSFYSEFGLAVSNPDGLRPLFRDRSIPVKVRVSLSLAPEEVAHIKANLNDMLKRWLWRQRIGRQYGDNMTLYSQMLLVQAQNPQMDSQIDQEVEQLRSEALRELAQSHYHAGADIAPGGHVTTKRSIVASLLFSLVEPEKLGIIDYYSANRGYGRETVNAFSVDLNQPTVARSDTYLYNTGAKFTTIKSELTTAYVKELLRREAGLAQPDDSSTLDASLISLFQMFFPDKSYTGMTISPETGGPEFLVSLNSGGSHDLSDLSSGEKEVIYGYLRLRANALKNSLVLIDEPELHLNPALLGNFPKFYRTQIGKARDNQMILVTHSDAILKPVVGDSDYQVIHLSPASVANGENQASEVSGANDLQRTVLALVGDVATYSPRAKSVILEGESGFDKTMVTMLFPEFAQTVNLLSAGNKARVQTLLATLSTKEFEGDLQTRFFAITDSDSKFGEIQQVLDQNALQWDVYHIENYLLEDNVIAKALARLLIKDVSPEDVAQQLHSAAETLIDSLVYEDVRLELNDRVRRCIDLGRQFQGEPSRFLNDRVSTSVERIRDTAASLGLQQIQELMATREADYRKSLNNDDWRKKFPGRRILSAFAEGAMGGRVNYVTLRNVILTEMASANFAPEGMKRVLQHISDTN